MTEFDHPDTVAIRSGRSANGTALNAPIWPNAVWHTPTLEFARKASAGARAGQLYGRYANPTVNAFEEAIASLEGAESALAFGSGMGAIASVVFALCSHGDHIVAQRHIYSGTQMLLQGPCARMGIDVTWVVLAAAGIALITPWTAHSGVDPIGVALAFAAGVCWALYIVLGKRLSHVLSGGAAVSIGMLVAAIVVVPFAAAAGGFAHVTAGRFATGVGVALLSSVIPFTLEMVALKALPARTFGILMSLEPAVAALVGLAFLREVLSAIQWIAIALVIAASAGSTLTSRGAPEPHEAEADEGWQGG